MGSGTCKKLTELGYPQLDPDFLFKRLGRRQDGAARARIERLRGVCVSLVIAAAAAAAVVVWFAYHYGFMQLRSTT